MLQCFCNPVEPLVYGRDLILHGVDLRARCRVLEPIGAPQPEHWTIVSYWLAPRGVNGASSKLCPAHFRHVETAIFDVPLPAELLSISFTKANLPARGAVRLPALPMTSGIASQRHVRCWGVVSTGRCNTLS